MNASSTPAAAARARSAAGWVCCAWTAPNARTASAEPAKTDRRMPMNPLPMPATFPCGFEGRLSPRLRRDQLHACSLRRREASGAVPPDQPARPLAREAGVAAPSRHAVGPDLLDALGRLNRVLEGGAVDHPVRVEQHE